MRLLYALICVLLIAWAAFGQPPKAPPVVPEKAPPVSDSGVVTYRTFQDARGQWWMVPETNAAPEVAARPFQESSVIRTTIAQPASSNPAKGKGLGWSGATPGPATFTNVRSAVGAGNTNCQGFR
jgi:hypothetical protein